MIKFIILFDCILIFGTWEILRAGIVDSSYYGFAVRDEIIINEYPGSVYNHIIRDIGKWWDSEHTYSGDAANLSIQASSNGCFCERLPGGGSVTHMSLIYTDPGKTIRLSGGLGPIQAMAVQGTLTISMIPEDKATKAVFIYTVGGYSPDGLQKYATLVDQVLSQQWRRLKSYIETLPGPSDSGRSEKE